MHRMLVLGRCRFEHLHHPDEMLMRKNNLRVRCALLWHQIGKRLFLERLRANFWHLLLCFRKLLLVSLASLVMEPLEVAKLFCNFRIL